MGRCGSGTRLAASETLAFEGHQSQVTYLACSPNGRWLASSGGVWDDYTARYTAGELRLWDLHTGTLLHHLAGHSSGVTCVGFSPDGRYLASRQRRLGHGQASATRGVKSVSGIRPAAPRWLAWRGTPAASCVWPSAPTAGSWPAAA